MGGPELSIVIPVFNEEAVIPVLIDRLRSFVGRLTPLVTEIILVDDHSTDLPQGSLIPFCSSRQE
jgi:polyisoprenyl-phosphate glycosyltransferase